MIRNHTLIVLGILFVASGLLIGLTAADGTDDHDDIILEGQALDDDWQSINDTDVYLVDPATNESHDYTTTNADGYFDLGNETALTATVDNASESEFELRLGNETGEAAIFPNASTLEHVTPAENSTDANTADAVFGNEDAVDDWRTATFENTDGETHQWSPESDDDETDDDTSDSTDEDADESDDSSTDDSSSDDDLEDDAEGTWWEEYLPDLPEWVEDLLGR